MAYFGKEFKFEKQENYDGFINALSSGKLSDQFKQAMISHKPTVKIVKSGDSYILYTSRPDNRIDEIKFTPGVEFEEELNGNKSKSKITVNGNVFTHTMNFPEGSITIKREFSDNALVATYTSTQWNGTAVRYFKA